MNSYEMIFYGLSVVMLISTLCLKTYTLFIMEETGYNPQNDLNRYISIFTSFVILIGVIGTPSLVIMVIPAILVLICLNHQHIPIRHAFLFSVVHYFSSIGIVTVKLFLLIISGIYIMATNGNVEKLESFDPFSQPFYIRAISEKEQNYIVKKKS